MANMTYIPPRNNKAKNIKIEDIDNNFQSNNVEGALKELAESGGSGHTHINKPILDTITQEKIDSWDDVTNKADKTEVLLSSKLNDNGTGIDELWSASKLSTQFNTIAKDLLLEDGKLYLKKADGTKIGTGVVLPGGSDSGTDGREIELQKSSTHIQWRYVGDSVWTNLITIDELKVKGDIGLTPNIQIGTVETLDSGSNANASISGTSTNPLLNLGIPKGSDGGGGGETTERAWVLLGSVTLTPEVVSAQWDVPNVNEIFVIMKNTDSSNFSAGWVKHCINNGSERGIKSGVVIDAGKSAIVIIQNFKKYIVSNMYNNLLDNFLGTVTSIDTSFTKIDTEQITNYKIMPTNAPISLEMEVYYR